MACCVGLGFSFHKELFALEDDVCAVPEHSCLNQHAQSDMNCHLLEHIQLPAQNVSQQFHARENKQ